MAYTYEQLSEMNVADLRKIADGIQHEAVSGHSTMHKDKLLPALCTALGIDFHIHHHVVGVNKSKIKLEIRSLKAQKIAAFKSHDKNQAIELRAKIKKLKHQLEKAMV